MGPTRSHHGERRFEAVGPNDRARFLVNANLTEVRRVLEVLAEWAVEEVGNVDLTNKSVVECQSQAISLEGLNSRHPDNHAQCHATRLS